MKDWQFSVVIFIHKCAWVCKHNSFCWIQSLKMAVHFNSSWKLSCWVLMPICDSCEWFIAIEGFSCVVDGFSLCCCVFKGFQIAFFIQTFLIAKNFRFEGWLPHKYQGTPNPTNDQRTRQQEGFAAGQGIVAGSNHNRDGHSERKLRQGQYWQVYKSSSVPWGALFRR